MFKFHDCCKFPADVARCRETHSSFIMFLFLSVKIFFSFSVKIKWNRLNINFSFRKYAQNIDLCASTHAHQRNKTDDIHSLFLLSPTTSEAPARHAKASSQKRSTIDTVFPFMLSQYIVFKSSLRV